MSGKGLGNCQSFPYIRLQFSRFYFLTTFCGRISCALFSRFALLSVGLAACGETDDSSPTAPDQSLTAAASYTVHALSIPTNAINGDATSINDAGIVAGWYRTNAGWTAVRWTSPLSDRVWASSRASATHSPRGINQAGTIVGFASTSDFLNARAFIWTQAGGIKPLPDLGGGSSLAMGINTAGVAVGISADPQQVTHAVKWTAAGTVVDLNPMGATSEALAINDSGDVAGWVFPRRATRPTPSLASQRHSSRPRYPRWSGAARPSRSPRDRPWSAYPTAPRPNFRRLHLDPGNRHASPRPG